MKKIMLAGGIGCIALVTLCGPFTTTLAGVANGTPSVVSTELTIPAGLNFTGWVATDLSKYNPDIKLMMTLPKTAKIVKNETEGLEIKVSDDHALFVMKVDQESLLYDKANLANRKMYDIGKVLKEEANGLIISGQPKQLEGYEPYPTETHFIYYLGPLTAPLYRISDERPADNTATPETYYSEPIAKLFYDQVKATAKIK